MSDFRRLHQRWYIYVLCGFIGATVADCDGSKIQKRKEQVQPSTGAITIVGIAVDRPLALPQCKKGDIEFIGGAAWEGIYNGSTTCYVEITLSEKEEAELAKTIDPLFRSRREYRVYTPAASTPFYISEIILSTLHDKVAEIVIDTTGGDGQDFAFADLKSKFGNPSDTKGNMLQNGFGAQFASIDASWLLLPQNVTVIFEGISEDRDKGHITLRNQAFTDADREFSARNPAPHL